MNFEQSSDTAMTSNKKEKTSSASIYLTQFVDLERESKSVYAFEVTTYGCHATILPQISKPFSFFISFINSSKCLPKNF